MDSSAYLPEHLHEVPVLVVPCIEGRVDNATLLVQAVIWASTYRRRGASRSLPAPVALGLHGRVCISHI